MVIVMIAMVTMVVVMMKHNPLHSLATNNILSMSDREPWKSTGAAWHHQKFTSKASVLIVMVAI